MSNSLALFDHTYPSLTTQNLYGLKGLVVLLRKKKEIILFPTTVSLNATLEPGNPWLLFEE